jgi:hypothetical protein
MEDFRKKQNKVAEIKTIISQHRNELNKLKKEILDVGSDYHKFIDEVEIKELRKKLTKNEQ